MGAKVRKFSHFVWVLSGTGCVKPMVNLDGLLLLEFMVDANVVLAGAGLFYWSKPIAARLNAWSVKPYERFPKLKMLPGSRNAGTELNYRTMFICFRLCGAFLFVVASYNLSHAISRIWR